LIGELIALCGIFGFALKKPVSLTKVFGVLKELEVHRYRGETRTVGGYGAGLAILREDGSILFEKVGKTTNASPARKLSRMVKADKAAVLVAHVRFPSPEFMEKAWRRETAQPYVAACSQGLTVVSAHNGYIKNYKMIREKLGRTHVLESEKIQLVDSEIIPHYFEEFLKEKGNTGKALDDFHFDLEGRMALSLLQVEKKRAFLHLFHKGKTRGLVIWTNPGDEVVFCSRKEPLVTEFADILAEGKFEEQVLIPWNEERSLSESFALEVDA
jgi:glucosamine 6-phosphate synthetase-like amidotransferase/phosphosugar isomerase protein